jgi:hypothetical protein
MHRRHDHWRAPEAEREVLVVRFEGRTEGREKGRGGVGWHPFKRHGGGRGSGVGVRMEEGEGRRGGGGLAWRRPAGNDPRLSGAGGVVLRGLGSPGG